MVSHPREPANRTQLEEDAMAFKIRPVYGSRTRPPGWTLGAPRRPGQYWYSEFRGTPAHLVTVAWQETPGSTDGPELVFYSEEGEPGQLTKHSTGWWRI